MTNKSIIQHKPVFDQNDANAVKKIIESGWISEGKETKKFEENFRNYIGTKYAVATTSGTTALYLSLLSLGIKKGDEVIIPNLTFAATGNAVHMTGAKPVLADIDEKSFTLSLDSLKRKISKKTKAIIPVHLNGRSTNMDKLIDLSKKSNFKIIEDAAQALGSHYKKKSLGSIGDVGIFSLSPPKIITTGQGGMITTNDSELYQKILLLKDQGRSDKSDNHPTIGYNFKITDLHAALGNSQFKKLPNRIKTINKIFKCFSDLIVENNSVFIPQKKKWEQLWYFDLLSNKKQQLITFLLKNNIQTRSFYRPLSSHPSFSTKSSLHSSQKISSLGLYLPSHASLTQKNIELISSKINQFFK